MVCLFKRTKKWSENGSFVGRSRCWIWGRWKRSSRLHTACQHNAQEASALNMNYILVGMIKWLFDFVLFPIRWDLPCNAIKLHRCNAHTLISSIRMLCLSFFQQITPSQRRPGIREARYTKCIATMRHSLLTILNIIYMFVECRSPHMFAGFGSN